jgi:hypothetical protein
MEDRNMVRLLNRHSFLLIFLIMVSFMSSSIWGCDSGGGGGGNNNTRINGTVLEVVSGSVSDIRVSIFNSNDKRIDSTRTNQLGQFTLRFKPNSDTVKIEFEVSDSQTLSRFIAVTRDSDVIFNVTLLVEAPSEIIVNDWTVFQDRVRTDGSDELTFDSLEADFEIDGDGNTCIRAHGDSLVEITARSINLSDCNIGIDTQGSGFVLLEADEDITISANKDAIKTSNDSFVRVTETVTPVDNNIFITSLREHGIKAAGNSEVEINPQNDCSISGAKSAIDQTGSSVVDPDGCTLVDG